jgi:hypothetical protein
MGINNFINNQPHPENDETACVRQGGLGQALAAALDVRTVSCGGAFADGNFLLFTVEESAPGTVYRYQGTSPESLAGRREIAFFDLPVTAVSCWEGCDPSGSRSGLCVCAGKVSLFDFDGKPIAILPLTARCASVLEDGDAYWLCYDGKVRRLNETQDGFAGEAVNINSAPYFLTKTRYDSLYAGSRAWPGQSGGCLFRHAGRYYYFAADNFDRCGRQNHDTFCCAADTLDGHFTRRYLVIPNGGLINVFHGGDGKIYAAFVGSGPDSVVACKPAIVELDFVNSEFFRPPAGLVLEAGTVPSMRPFENSPEIRDTFIFNAPDGWYYMTGTTRRADGDYWSETNGICIWRSRNLEQWESLGKVFDYRETPESWQNQVSLHLNCWAPEIVFYDNTYWLTYSTSPGCGLLKSLSGDIKGPYADYGRVVMKGIDSGFFMEGETLYLIWQNGYIAPLTRDGQSFTAEPELLLPENDRQTGYEGAGLIKVAGKYVLYAAEWNGDHRIDGTYDMMYSVAENLSGPYSPRQVLVPHGGHGCLFYDKEGRLRFTLFGNDRTTPFRRRAAAGFVTVEETVGGLRLSV